MAAPSAPSCTAGLSVSFRTGGSTRILGRSFPTSISLDLPQGKHEAMVTWPGTDGLAYRMVNLIVGDEPVELELISGPPIRVTGSIVLEVGGVPSPADEIRCRLRTEFPVPSNNSGDPHCIGQDVVPGPYTLEMPRMPANAYVVSATASGVDMLAAPFRIDASVELEIRIAAPGAAIEGTATDEEGEPLTGATVVLVPDAPLREAGLRYRTVETDIRGRYELTGIAPGSYELFAWSELEGAAYRNADFMADFWGRGIPVRIEDPETIAVDVTAF
jgi:hypothetical protein